MKGIGDAPPRAFEHALYVDFFTLHIQLHSFQTGCMFVGELICLFVFRLTLLFQKKKKDAEVSISEKPKAYVRCEFFFNTLQVNPLLFWIPACCDLGGTTLLNVGLFLVRKKIATTSNTTS